MVCTGTIVCNMVLDLADKHFQSWSYWDTASGFAGDVCLGNTSCLVPLVLYTKGDAITRSDEYPSAQQ